MEVVRAAMAPMDMMMEAQAAECTVNASYFK
jgi:hypothetical protein